MARQRAGRLQIRAQGLAVLHQPKSAGRRRGVESSIPGAGADRARRQAWADLWQLAHTKKFDAGEIEDFLALLPASRDGVALRHAIEPRHESFRHPDFVALARKAGAAIVMAEHETYPQVADLTADFVYARLQCAKEAEPLGYSKEALDRWAQAAKGWAAGESPAGLDYSGDAAAEKRPRDVFLFFIGATRCAIRSPPKP